MVCDITFMNMTLSLSHSEQERAKIVTRFEVWNLIVEVQQWQHTLKG